MYAGETAIESFRTMGVSMSFLPTSEKLMPDLSPREEIVLLARTLWREGYSDHLAGHITFNLGDDTLLCNPWHLLWNEFRAHDVIRIDLEGNVLEGDWPVAILDDCRDQLVLPVGERRLGTHPARRHGPR